MRHISNGIFDNVIAKWTFCVEQFFSAKNYLQTRYYKNWECNHCLSFSSPPFLLLALSFSPFLFLYSLLFVRLVFNKSARYTFSVSVSVTLTKRSTTFKFVDLHCLFLFFFYFKVPRLKGPRNFFDLKIEERTPAAACSSLKDKDPPWQLSMIFPRPQNNLCWGHLLLCWTSQRNFFFTVCQIVGQMCLPMIYFRRDFFGLFV